MNEDKADRHLVEISSGNVDGIIFPFKRDQDYPIRQLEDFEASLLQMARSDTVLSNRLRTPTDAKWRWIKLRNEELKPLLYCVRHHKFSLEAFFRIMPEGNPVDLKVRDGDLEVKLQVTVADPVWLRNRNGSQHHIMVDALNTGVAVNVFGPYKKTGGIVTGPDRMTSVEDVDRAFGDGFKQALERKSKKEGVDQILVIYCRYLLGAITPERFRKLAKQAIDSCNKINFIRVWFVDSGENFFIEFEM